jgi:putative DNA primase/helicase
MLDRNGNAREAGSLAGARVDETQPQPSSEAQPAQVNGQCGVWRSRVFHPIDPTPEALAQWLRENPAPEVKPQRWENDQLLVRFCAAELGGDRYISDRHVTYTTGAGFDLDKGANVRACAAKLAQLGLGGVFHTTHSHSEEQPAHRLYVWWTSPCPPAEHKRAWKALHAALCPDAPTECCNRSRGHNAPKPGASVLSLPGAAADWRALAATAPPDPEAQPTPGGDDRWLAYARAWLAEQEPAKEGKGGDAQLFNVACGLRVGWLLDDASCWQLLDEYNARCLPPWSADSWPERRQHKLNEARERSTRQPGYLRPMKGCGSLNPAEGPWELQPAQPAAGVVTPEALADFIRRFAKRKDADPGAVQILTRLKVGDPVAPEEIDRVRTTLADAFPNGNFSHFLAESCRHAGVPVASIETTPQTPDEQRTDLGNARRLVRMHGHELRHFRGRKLWLAWDGVRWKADQTGEIIRRAKSAAESLWEEARAERDDEKRKAAFQWAAQCQNQGKIAAMVALAESEPGVPVTAADLDADPWLLNTQSGVLDLRTGTLAPPDPRWLQTKVCAAAYVPGASSELWERFVGELFGEDLELRAYVQRAMGYALFGAWREKAFWFGYGPPDGGKSTFLGVVADVLGDYAVNADASTWMLQTANGGNRGDVTRLLGARLVTTLEVRASARFDQQLMKKVTGGDALVAAAKYEADIEFKPTFGLWFGANDRPIIPDDDEGFWSRVRCVPFTRVVPKERQDKGLREKLSSPEHAPAVLAWLAQGCRDWQQRGLGSCAAVEQATTSYRRDTNQASGFFDDCLRLAPEAEASCADVAAAYQSWAQRNGVRNPLAPKQLGARLRQLGAKGGDDSSRKNGARRWFGIQLLAAQPLGF